VRIYEFIAPSRQRAHDQRRELKNLDRGIVGLPGHSGANTNYTVYVLENGDKFFARSTKLAPKRRWGKLTTSSVGAIRGHREKLVGTRNNARHR